MSIFQAASFWNNFRHEPFAADGVCLHYVEGGSGSPVLLIPGWPVLRNDGLIRSMR
jgi:hypothetical protein